jgi:hypothetical protein
MSIDVTSSPLEEVKLLERPLIGGKDLVNVLGFKTSAAFRQALKLNRLGIETFTIKGRRGRFAFTQDVQQWLQNLKK